MMLMSMDDDEDDDDDDTHDTHDRYDDEILGLFLLVPVVGVQLYVPDDVW